MITARLLNQDATLNNYKQIGGISFINGDTIRVVIQLFNEELGVRHLASTSGTPGAVSLTVNVSDNSTTNNVLTMANLPGINGAADSSIWFADIVTNNVGGASKILVGGNVTFNITNDLNLPTAQTSSSGIIFNALQRIIVS